MLLLGDGVGDEGWQPVVENIQGQFFGKIATNMERVQKIVSSTKGRASRAPSAGHFLYRTFFHTCCNFSRTLALDLFYNAHQGPLSRRRDETVFVYCDSNRGEAHGPEPMQASRKSWVCLCQGRKTGPPRLHSNTSSLGWRSSSMARRCR